MKKWLFWVLVTLVVLALVAIFFYQDIQVVYSGNSVKEISATEKSVVQGTLGEVILEVPADSTTNQDSVALAGDDFPEAPGKPGNF